MDGCRQKCWIIGGAAGLVVLLALVLGGASILTGLLLGAMTAGLLGGLLVWGLCDGPGTEAENDALRALTWEPEPFTPSRRVVAPGGRVVEQRPLEGAQAAVPAGLAGAAEPLERVTLQASRDPARAQLVEVAAPADETPGPTGDADAADIPPPSETVALLATPSVASAIPVAPIALEAAVGPDVPVAKAEAAADDRPEAEAEAGAIPPFADDRAIGADRVVTITDPLPADAGPAVADDLLAIKGVGPMLAQWLRDNGVTRLDQIAAWDEADIAHFAIMMGRMGHRIRTEDWVGQARALTGGRA